MRSPAFLKAVFRRTGLIGKILIPVSLLFLLIGGGFATWMSSLSQKVLHAQTEHENAYQTRIAKELLSASETAFRDGVTSPLVNAELAPIVEDEMVDQVTTLLASQAEVLKSDAMYVFDRKGRFLAGMRDFTEMEAPSFLKVRVEKVFASEEPRWGWVLAPRELLAFDELPSLSQRGGQPLGFGVATLLRNDFGDPIGVLVGFRFFGEDSNYMGMLAEKLGAVVAVAAGAGDATIPEENGRVHLVMGKTQERGSVTGRIPLSGPEGQTVGTVYVQTAAAERLLFGQFGGMNGRILLVGVLAMVLFSLLVYGMTRRSLGSVATILGHLHYLAEGGLNRELRVRTGDEIEKVAHGINVTTESLKRIVVRVRDSFAAAEGATTRLVGMRDAIASGTQREEEVADRLEKGTIVLSRLVEDVSARMNDLQASVRQNVDSLGGVSKVMKRFSERSGVLYGSAEATASAMNEMSVSVNQVADHMNHVSGAITETSESMSRIDGSVQEVKKISDRSRDLAKTLSSEASVQGRDAMNRAREGMDEILTLVSNLGESVERVGKGTRNIDEIIVLNLEIGEQVKLLSLNASILAAQAGEHGKGFSVVADAIGRLSEKTNNTIHDIESHVSKIRAEGELAVAEVRKGVATVQTGAERVSAAEAVFDRIIAVANETRDQTDHLARQTDAQAEASAEVVKTLTGITDMVQEVDQAMGEQARAGRYVYELAEKMKTESDEIREEARVGVESTNEVTRVSGGSAEDAQVLAGNAAAARQTLEELREVVSVILGVIEENRKFVLSLDETVGLLQTQSESVAEQIAVFRFEEPASPQAS